MLAFERISQCVLNRRVFLEKLGESVSSFDATRSVGRRLLARILDPALSQLLALRPFIVIRELRYSCRVQDRERRVERRRSVHGLIFPNEKAVPELLDGYSTSKLWAYSAVKFLLEP
jgi:hypothetical protein